MDNSDYSNNIELMKKATIDILQMKKKSQQIEIFENLTNKITEFFPKKTKSLGKRFHKELFEIKDIRLMILVIHLYLENFLDGIISENLPKPKHILKLSFYNKLQILDSLGLLKAPTYQDIRLINELRNKFVHNLDYDLVEFDISKFSDLEDIVENISFKRKNDLRKCYTFLLRNQMLFTLWNLSKEHRVIYHL